MRGREGRGTHRMRAVVRAPPSTAQWSAARSTAGPLPLQTRWLADTGGRLRGRRQGTHRMKAVVRDPPSTAQRAARSTAGEAQNESHSEGPAVYGTAGCAVDGRGGTE